MVKEHRVLSPGFNGICEVHIKGHRFERATKCIMHTCIGPPPPPMWTCEKPKLPVILDCGIHQKSSLCRHFIQMFYSQMPFPKGQKWYFVSRWMCPQVLFPLSGDESTHLAVIEGKNRVQFFSSSSQTCFPSVVGGGCVSPSLYLIIH